MEQFDAIVMGADAAVAWDGDTEDIVGVVAAAAAAHGNRTSC